MDATRNDITKMREKGDKERKKVWMELQTGGPMVREIYQRDDGNSDNWEMGEIRGEELCDSSTIKYQAHQTHKKKRM